MFCCLMRTIYYELNFYILTPHGLKEVPRMIWNDLDYDQAQSL